jgi:RadC-like JAB domain
MAFSPSICRPSRALNRNTNSLASSRSYSERSDLPRPRSNRSLFSASQQADELITCRLKEALSLIDVRILDHIIVAGGDTISFAERGIL